MQNVKLAFKLVGGFLAVVVITLAVGLAGYRGISDLGQALEGITTVRMPAIDNLRKMSKEFESFRVAQRTLLIPGLSDADRARQYSNIDDAWTRYQEDLAAYRALPKDPQEAALFAEMEAAVADWKAENDRFVEMARAVEATGIPDTADFQRLVLSFENEYQNLLRTVSDMIIDGGSMQGGEDLSETSLGKWLAADAAKIKDPDVQKHVRSIQQLLPMFHKVVGRIKQSMADRDYERAKSTYNSTLSALGNSIFGAAKELQTDADRVDDVYMKMRAMAFGSLIEKQRAALGVAAKIISMNAERAESQTVAAEATAKADSRLALGAMLFGGALALVLGLWLSRSITLPITRTVAYARAVADGDYDLDLDIHRKDEVGVLATALRGMVAALKRSIADADHKAVLADEKSREAEVALKHADEANRKAATATREGILHAAQRIDGVVEVVTSASEELAAQVEQSSRGAEVQKERVAETATAMEQMTATVLEVARSAGQASASAEQAMAAAREGDSVVAKVVEAILSVEADALAMSGEMAELGKRAESIGNIMRVIEDIADQTNLLALNAAIEAARAGDAGRGFAVVADEVRKLAEKTMTATKEVAQSIGSIQTAARSNIQAMERSSATVDGAAALARRSGEQLRQIVGLVEQNAGQAASIATASEEQSAASEQISRSLEEVNRVAMEASEAMTQSAQAVSELARQAANLRVVVDEMKQE